MVRRSETSLRRLVYRADYDLIGTTSECYAWHIIIPGDSCSLLESAYGITFRQLQRWNPNLSDDCLNLLLGEAYCVNGASAASTQVVLLP